MSWFASSPARRNDADRTERTTASRWRICRIRHHERGFAFAIEGSRRAAGYLWPSPLLSGPVSACQFLSSAAPFERDRDVLRRVWDRRADLSGALRSLLSEETSGRESSRSPRSRTLYLVRFLSSWIRLVQGRPRTRPAGAPPRGRRGPSAVGARELHPGGSGRGS